MDIIQRQGLSAFHFLYHALDTGYEDYLRQALNTETDPWRKHALQCSLHHLEAVAEFVDGLTEKDLGIEADEIEEVVAKWELDEPQRPARNADGQLTREFKVAVALIRIGDIFDRRAQADKFLEQAMHAIRASPVPSESVN